MFNRCWRWRNLLSRRADSALTPKEWGRLQDHLASCSPCRQMADADDALHEVLGIQEPRLSTEHAQRFDDTVVAALKQGTGNRRAINPFLACIGAFRSRLVASLRSLSLTFFAQIGGGAALAMGLTAFCLLPALHYGNSGKATVGRDAGIQDPGMSGIPVSMSTLLNNPSPRAAMLWSAPRDLRKRDKQASELRETDYPAQLERNGSENLYQSNPAIDNIENEVPYPGPRHPQEGLEAPGFLVPDSAVPHPVEDHGSVPANRPVPGEKHSGLVSTVIVV